MDKPEVTVDEAYDAYFSLYTSCCDDNLHHFSERGKDIEPIKDIDPEDKKAVAEAYLNAAADIAKEALELGGFKNKEEIMSEYPVFKKREDLLSDKSLINENDSVKELLLDLNGNVWFRETFVPEVESPFIHRVCISAIQYGDDWDIANIRQNLNTVFRSSSLEDWKDFTQLDNAYGGNVHNYVPWSVKLRNGVVGHPVCLYACSNEKSHENISVYAIFQESADRCNTEFMMCGHLNENRLEKFVNALKTDGIMESFGYKDSKVLDALKDFRKKNETEKEMPVELDLSEVGKRKEQRINKDKGM